jgi:hypothetical protein
MLDNVIRGALVLVAVVVAGGARGDTAVAGFTPAQLDLAGIKLGALIGDVEQLPALKGTRCDDDPLDGGTRHVWFHAPCAGASALPGGTLVALFTGRAVEGKPGREPIDAIAWMFGDWPHAAGKFPAAVGAPQRDLERALGPSTRLFDFAGLLDGGERRQVLRHGERVFSIVEDGRAIGFVVGAMGADRNKEEWSGLVANMLKVRKQVAGAPEPPRKPGAPRDLASDAARYSDKACDRTGENLSGRGDAAHCGPFPCDFGHCVVEKCGDKGSCHPGFCEGGWCVHGAEAGARDCPLANVQLSLREPEWYARCRCAPQSATARRDRERCASFPCAPDGCYVQRCSGDGDCRFGVCSGHASGPHGYCVTDDPY